jgi:hypothetical protein
MIHTCSPRKQRTRRACFDCSKEDADAEEDEEDAPPRVEPEAGGEAWPPEEADSCEPASRSSLLRYIVILT